MTTQKTIVLPPFPRGIHLITNHVVNNLEPLPAAGLLHLFIRHTSAGLTLNENADPDVMADLEGALDSLAPDGHPAYTHTMEGPDDMPAHIKATLAGSSVSIPIVGGKLALGTWQGICLCEFRNHARGRTLVATVIS